MDKQKHILVAGCGYLGEIFAEKCLLKGHIVDALRRDPTKLDNPKLNTLAVDMAQPFSLEKPYDWIVFCAAPNDFSKEAYTSTYLDCLKNLGQAAQEHSSALTNFLFVSSTSVYSQTDGSEVNESSPTQPKSFSGQIMLEAEAVAQQQNDQAIVLRLGGIYGPQRTGFIERIKQQPILNTLNPMSNRIHSHDAADAMLFLLEKNSTGIFNCVDPNPTPINDIITWLAKELDIELIDTVEKTSSPQRGNKSVSSKKLVSSGFTFQYPDYKSGYGQLLKGEAACKA